MMGRDGEANTHGVVMVAIHMTDDSLLCCGILSSLFCHGYASA